MRFIARLKRITRIYGTPKALVINESDAPSQPQIEFAAISDAVGDVSLSLEKAHFGERDANEQKV